MWKIGLKMGRMRNWEKPKLTHLPIPTGSKRCLTCSDYKKLQQETLCFPHTELPPMLLWASWNNWRNDCRFARQPNKWSPWLLPSTVPYGSCSLCEQYCALHGMKWKLQIHNHTSSFLPETAVVFWLSRAWLFPIILNIWQEEKLLAHRFPTKPNEKDASRWIPMAGKSHNVALPDLIHLLQRFAYLEYDSKLWNKVSVKAVMTNISIYYSEFYKK